MLPGEEWRVSIRRVLLRIVALTGMLAIAACARASPKLYGTVLQPISPAPAITAIDQNGAPFALARERGRVVALYFGFTHCKDICPQTLANLGAARAKFGRSSRVAILFVSVDPARDTPAALRAFFARVGVRAVGITGTHAQMRRIWKAYGVEVQATRKDVGHSDFIYFIGPRGDLRIVGGDDMSIAHLAADMRGLAR
ncbi:MAG: SCO family protein [Candidatus Eremiobacteraeota bacterium]|nr:SCO family protein [Candidatus Eremiobacteraeota bacterium]